YHSAHGGARHFEPVDADRCMYVHRKSKLFAEGAQFRNAGLCAVSEAKVASFMNSTDLQQADENLANKIFGTHAGKRFIKGQHEDCVHAGLSQEAQAFGKEGEQLRRFFGIEELGRMRIEGDGDGAHTTLFCFGGGGGQNLLMPAMHSVEVADGSDGGA